MPRGSEPTLFNLSIYNVNEDKAGLASQLMINREVIKIPKGLD